MFQRIEVKEVAYKDALELLMNGEVLYKINPNKSMVLVKPTDTRLKLLFHKWKGGTFGIKVTKFCLVNDFNWTKLLPIGRRRTLETHIRKQKGVGFSWNIAYVNTRR